MGARKLDGLEILDRIRENVKCGRYQVAEQLAHEAGWHELEVDIYADNGFFGTAALVAKEHAKDGLSLKAKKLYQKDAEEWERLAKGGRDTDRKAMLNYAKYQRKRASKIKL